MTEGGAGTTQQATLSLTLSEPSTEFVSVDLGTSAGGPAATGGGACAGEVDYVQPRGTVLFDPGVVSRTVGVTVCGDATDEADEIFRVDLLDPVGATLASLRGRITILDDDDPALPTISIRDETFVEGSSRFVPFRVSLSAPSSQVVEVSGRATPGTGSATVGNGPPDDCGGNDVQDGGDQAAIFNPGVTNQNLIIFVCSDTVDEPDETFRVVLSFRSTNATVGDAVGVGTIIDDDAAALPTMSIGDATVIEGTGGNTTVLVPVTLSAASDQFVSATLTYNANPPNNTVRGSSCVTSTSTPGVDFSPTTPTVTFGRGTVTQGFTGTQGFVVLICGDTVDEVNETFQVELSNPVGATLGARLATVTIVDDDLSTVVVIPVNPVPPTISIREESVDEGSTAMFILRLSGAATQPVTVQFATSPKTANAGTSCTSVADYLTRSGTVTFPPGTTIRAFGVPTCDDLRGGEPSETFVVTLSSAVNATIGRGFVVGTIRE